MPNDIDTIVFSGFQSFGDYETSVKLSDLGPCLIVGMIDGDPTRSNGSGKSAFTNAPLWCWWERTMHSHTPGDRIINTHCDQAIVTTHMKDGQAISRKRTRGGESELSINGEVLGTTKLQQRKIMEVLGCDWNKFTSSAFITQLHKPWLSMTAPNRRKAFEKLFKLDIINDIANVAKSRITTYDSSITKTQADINKLKTDIDSITANIANLQQESANHKIEMIRQSKDLEEKAVKHRAEAANKPDIDMVKLAEKWAKFKQGEQIVEQVKQKYDAATGEITAATKSVAALLKIVQTKEKIKPPANIDLGVLEAEWDKYNEAEKTNKAILAECSKRNAEYAVEKQKLDVMKARLDELNGIETVCLRCGQPISHEQAATELNELTPVYEQARITVSELNTEINNIMKSQVNTAALKPKKTVGEAKLFNDNNDRIRRELLEAIETHATAQAEVVSMTEKSKTLEAKYIAASQILEKSRPQYTEQEAKANLESKKLCIELAERAEADAAAKLTQADPHQALIVSENARIVKLTGDIDALQVVLDGYVGDSRHMALLRKSYNDKNMIKSDLVGRLVTGFNSYLSYYTELFGSEVSVSIDNSLNVSTTCEHDYEFCSGGEKQRVDLGVDLSTFMTYMSLYGKFSNIMVLDEVDSKMDAAGVSALVTAVNEDLVDRFDSILVVSHMQRMRDSFSTKMIVNKINGFSHIHIEV